MHRSSTPSTIQRTATSSLQASIALVYTAVLLTVFEFWWLPTRIEARREGLPLGTRVVPGLEAGLSWSAACVVGYLLVPVVIVTMVHRDRLRAVGFSLVGFQRHILAYLGLFALMLPLIFLAARRPDFSVQYPFIAAARTDQGVFLRWEVAYLIQFIALESFFRGYLLFTLEKAMGGVAVFAMTVPYAMIHFHKPPIEALGAIVAGIALGTLALRFRTWAGGAVLHGLVAVTMDSLAVHHAGLF